jgi:hypothetical protein
MTSPVRLRQLSRIFGVPLTDPDKARSVIAGDPAALADAIFREAADSDDVTDVDGAREYLGSRLAEFSGVLSEDTAASIRATFEERLRAW